MIIDGRAIAQDILDETRVHVEKLGRPVVVRAVTVQPNAATDSYLRMKSARAEDAGMRMEVVRLPDNAESEEVIEAVRAAGADAVIVQLPLPDEISTSLVLDEVALEKDADVLSARAYERFAYGEPGALLPPVVDAVREVLQRASVPVAHKKVLVIGSGRLVGQPVSIWLERENADVTVITQENSDADRLAHLAQADIIISGAGTPHLIQPEHIKEGVVLIDAGTSESNGAIAGDADPACAEKANVFTPVPGGIGPIAVACLFRNAAHLARST